MGKNFFLISAARGLWRDEYNNWYDAQALGAYIVDLHKNTTLFKDLGSMAYCPRRDCGWFLLTPQVWLSDVISEQVQICSCGGRRLIRSEHILSERRIFTTLSLWH